MSADDLILFIKQNNAMRVAADGVLDDAIVARRNEDHLHRAEHLGRIGAGLFFTMCIMMECQAISLEL